MDFIIVTGRLRRAEESAIYSDVKMGAAGKVTTVSSSDPVIACSSTDH